MIKAGTYIVLPDRRIRVRLRDSTSMVPRHRIYTKKPVKAFYAIFQKMYTSFGDEVIKYASTTNKK